MTNDYKEQLLKYMTGKLDNETGNNVPMFDENAKYIENNVYIDLQEKLASLEDATYVLVLGKITNNSYSNFLIYGFYQNTLGYFGYVYIVDSNLEEVALITEFDSGTKLFPLVALNQDENNYIYGLSYEVENENPKTRILLLNNIFTSGQKSGDYSIKLRNSYIIPNSDSTYRMNPYRQNRIIKVQDEAKYYIVMRKNGQNQTIIIEFVINVGSQNEWNVYSIPYFVDRIKFSIVPYKNGDNLEIHLYGIDVTTNYSNATYYEYVLSNSTITQVNKIELNVSLDSLVSQVFVKNANEIYLSLGDITNNKVILYKLENTTINMLWSYNISLSESGWYTSELDLFWINDTVFCKFSNCVSDGVVLLKAGILQNDNLYFSESITNNRRIAGFHDYVDIYVLSNYNLKNIFMPHYGEENNSRKLTLIYNQNNYNGLPYKALNSLIPNSGILYDNDDDVIFARNLYNKTVSGATTTSTVQIPNTLLNDTTIAQSDLIGQTNMELVNDTTEITKNIYETVDINFSNTLIIRNDNDENNKILNPIGSSRLNNSVSQTIDYDNAQATKLRVNYADDTNLIITLSSAQITILTDTKARYSFSIYVDKEINNIQIISFDENTVYQTINNLNLTIGKIYNIIQDVEIL